jgi:hypothetical protein
MAAKPVKPYTAIENSSIARARHIGLAVLGALVIIKSHLNQKTGQCNPSYTTLAKEAGVDRSTMIRYVKRLKAVNLIDPQLRFRDDGGYAANQYQFSPAGEHPTPQQPVTSDNQDGEVAATRQPPPEEQGATPPLVAEMPPPGGTDATPPGGNFATTPSGADATALKNKTKERTRDVSALPTEKQQTCQHPHEEIAVLTAENIRICHHCWLLLDDNLPRAGNPALPMSPQRALPECEVRQLTDEPEAMQPPAGTPTKTASETPVKMAHKSPQIGSNGEKTAKMTNPLVLLEKLITGALQGG